MDDFDKFLADSGLKARTGWSGVFSVTSNDVRAWLFAAYQAGVLSETRRQENQRQIDAYYGVGE